MKKDRKIPITQNEVVTHEEFVFYIKNIREHLGMSEQQLSKETGYSVTSIKKYESGERVPRDAYAYILRLRNLIKKKRES